MRCFWKLGFGLAVVAQLLPVRVSAAEVGALKAGAARVEITPDANAIPRPFTSILDPLFARAIYLENGHDRSVLLNADVGVVPTAITDKVSSRHFTRAERSSCEHYDLSYARPQRDIRRSPARPGRSWRKPGGGRVRDQAGIGDGTGGQTGARQDAAGPNRLRNRQFVPERKS